VPPLRCRIHVFSSAGKSCYSSSEVLIRKPPPKRSVHWKGFCFDASYSASGRRKVYLKSCSESIRKCWPKKEIVVCLLFVNQSKSSFKQMNHSSGELQCTLRVLVLCRAVKYIPWCIVDYFVRKLAKKSLFIRSPDPRMKPQCYCFLRNLLLRVALVWNETEPFCKIIEKIKENL
jgi:hypothetical protein